MNCFQILYIRSLNTIPLRTLDNARKLWIAFRFCIFVLWTQCTCKDAAKEISCELLSDFVYSFFEHNSLGRIQQWRCVVNCFQILYIRSLNTIRGHKDSRATQLWIAFRFCIFVLWTQFGRHAADRRAPLWIAFRFCIFVLWTQSQWQKFTAATGCELLSDFVYSFFEHNGCSGRYIFRSVVNCFQILYIRSLNTISMVRMLSLISLWIAFRFCIFVLWTQ